jgi:hypothetical protein
VDCSYVFWAQSDVQRTDCSYFPARYKWRSDWQVNYIAAHLWSRFVAAYGAPPTALDMGEQEEVLPATYVALYNPLIYTQEFI